MSSLHRISVVAFAGALAGGACSLLAPDDDDYLKDDFAQDAAPANPDRTVSAPPDSAGESAGEGGAAGKDGKDGAAADRAVVDRVDGAEGQDAADGEDGPGGEDAAGSPDADAPCTSTTQCSTGRFCTPQGRCRLCSDPATLRNLADLEFGTPEPLGVINNAAGLTHLHHPRTIGATGLVYERSLFGTLIVLAPDMMKTPGAPLPAPIDVLNFSEAWPLSCKVTAGPLAAFNFFFAAEVERGSERPYELFGATIDESGYTAAVVRLPAPFNADPSFLRRNTALALSKNRAVWVTSDGSLLVEMVTARLDNPTTTILKVPDENNCALNQLD